MVFRALLRSVLIAFLGAAPACRETGRETAVVDKGGQEGKDVFGDSLIPSPAEEQLKKERVLGSELARTLECLDGVERARVHLTLADHSILSSERREKSKVAIVVKRNRATGPSEKTVRDLAAAAIPGLEPDGIRVFFTESPQKPSSTVFIGPIEVVSGSAAVARMCIGGLLVLSLALAALLVAAGIKMKKLKRRQP